MVFAKVVAIVLMIAEAFAKYLVFRAVAIFDFTINTVLLLSF